MFRCEFESFQGHGCCFLNRAALGINAPTRFFCHTPRDAERNQSGTLSQGTYADHYWFSASVWRFFACTLWVQLQSACTSPSPRSMAMRVQLLLQLLARDLASLVSRSAALWAWSECSLQRDLRLVLRHVVLARPAVLKLFFKWGPLLLVRMFYGPL
jgi:hypothetical protein